MAKSNADVPCHLGRVSANLTGLEGVAKGSTEVPAFSEKSADLIMLDGMSTGNADIPCVLGRESANLIELE